jgi:hypothetical protein
MVEAKSLALIGSVYLIESYCNQMYYVPRFIYLQYDLTDYREL